MRRLPNGAYHHRDLRGELIREGLQILDREGYEEFSLRKAAKACGVSHAAPYRHFRNKDELVEAILMEAMRAFGESLEQAARLHPDSPRERLKEIGVAYVRFFSANPAYLRILFAGDIIKKLGDGAAAEVCGGKGHRMEGHPFGTLLRAVKDYVTARPAGAMGEEELILYCWGLVHGMSVLIAGEEFFGGARGLETAERVLRSESFFA